MLIDRVKFFEEKIADNQSRLPYAQMEQAIKEHPPAMQMKVLAAWSMQPKVSTK